MNARALAAWSGACLVVALASVNPVYRALAALCALNVLLAGLPEGRSARPVLTGTAIAAGVALLLNPLLNHTGAHAFAALPDWLPGIGGPLTLESLAYGLAAGSGLAAAILAVAPLSLCLEPEDLVDALPRQLERTGAALAAGLNLVPAIGRSLVAVSEAQRMRGWKPRGPRSWPEVVVPVMLTAIEDSLQLAESMEARAFGSGPRTRFRAPRLGPAGALMVAAAAVVATAFVAARLGGRLPDWQPFPVAGWPSVEPVLVAAALLLLAPAGSRWRR